ncbi:MAG: hypothetical protein JWM99_1881, partial [Verrucomicrobiales bacterium]|nr:hypothetical protein [Verrucomicrobiales bacterium]
MRSIGVNGGEEGAVNFGGGGLDWFYKSSQALFHLHESSS